MNSTLRHGLLHQGFCRTTISDNNDKGYSRKFVNSFYQVFPSSLARSASDLSKTFVPTKFGVKSCNLKKVTSRAQSFRTLYMSPRSVLMTNPMAEHVGKFNLDGKSELLIDLSAPVSGYPFFIDIRVTNTNTSLILHWGVIRDGQKNSWTLPSHRPDGTTVYKDRALRTPFKRSDSNSILRIEIGDPQVKAFEFLIFDETRNKWFKNNGQNFCFSLQTKNNPKIDLLIPEDLVQIQAYLRWEARGKQMYTPEKEKEEYDAARNDLLEEIARGISIDDLRKRLTGNDRPNEARELNGTKTANVSQSKIPHELVQTQAYIRWERAGKPMYSQEKQLIEFEEARKELQLELDHGATIEEIRNRISKGNIQRKVSNQHQSKKYFTSERIQPKKRDMMNFINKVSLRIDKISDAPIPPKSANILELFLKRKEAQDGGIVLNKKRFKLGDRELLVFIIDLNGKVKAHIATTFEDPLILHWGLSKKSGEWMVPPQNVLPEGTTIQDGACETQFAAGMYENSYIQNIEIDLGEGDFVGIPFVLLSNGNWIKNGGSDFYLGFNKESAVSKDVGDGNGTAKTLLDRIAEMESEAQKSFMHRFNIASDLIEEAKVAGELGFAGILVWMRFMATRQLIWNKNYNVKPREISRAQDRLTNLLQNIYRDLPQHREFVRMIMSTIGRGGEGDVGQRIRDEILVIQRNNNCKGGMMEEWHQKLHNNTSPDDVIICQALIDYISNDFNINVYWNTLKSNGITKERLLSYDRAIHSEPNFQKDQKQGLLRDLGNYLRTLKAVHSGADLESAITTCLGYSVEGEGFMVGVQINPVAGLPSGFPALLKFIVDHLEDKWVEPLLEGLLEARLELQPLLLKDHDRLKDLIFLDLSLDSTVRTTIERGYEELNNAEPERLMYFVTLILQNLALSSDNNEDLIYCLKGWLFASDMCKRKDEQWALYAKSVLDRTRLALESKAHHYHQVLQPSAEYLGSLLGVEQWAINLFTEEIIRAGSAASLSGLLNRFDPILRKKANLGSWQIISPVEVVGYVVVVDDLLAVQNKSYTRPTILVAKTVKGEEEIPDGTVGVLTPDMPDVLSHVSVRARNGKVLFATCFDSNILNDLQGKEGKLLLVKPTSSNIIYSETKDSDINSETQDESFSTLSLVRKQFCGQYAISSQEFTSEMVGAKSRNISYLKGKVPSWVGIPTSVALPFGSFEKVLSEDSNKEVSEKLQSLKQCLEDGDFSVLSDIRSAVLQLTAPSELVQELKNKMQSSEMPWPGDEGEDRWNQAWMCIKKVWASKWNERAFFSTRKVKLNHDYLSMSVLVQEIISADYAFVIHTTNPSSGDSSEIYAEVVKGLGETLVGAYPGRALSFICKKNDLDSPKILGYPSKPIGLFIRQSIIFRSDSNGEDLDGYAGAGLYDSVPMDEEEKRVLDYTTDPLINDKHFKNSILSSIAKAGSVIEKLYGSPQDIEGVVKDGKIFVVQTRPQM